MHRRHFIRLIGGGTAAAAALGATGCSTAYPGDTVAPWQGPPANAELRRWALGYAILAPNSHNRQPWWVDLRQPDAITLHVDRERLLPETDPWSRQIIVSQGTFIESLVIALKERGVDPEVELFPHGEFVARALDDRPVATLRWRAGGPAPAKDPLFAQLLKRQTAKVGYDTTRPVAPAVVEELLAAARRPRVQGGGTVEPAQLEKMRQLCWDSAKAELLTARTVMESIRLTRVGPAEISQHRDGISIMGVMPRLLSAVGAFDRSQPPVEGSGAYKAMMSRFEEHSRTAMGFVWLSTPFAADAAAGRTRSAEVEAGRAYMRLQLAATRLGIQVHPMSQAPQEFAEMKPHYDALHQLTVGKPATTEVVQMFCRIGYCAPQAPTPRRGVDAIIRV